MKQILRQVCVAAVILLLSISMMGGALATSRASIYLTKYTAKVTAVTGGRIDVTFSVGANQRVSELGASYILLEESDNGGKTWTTAREYQGESWMTATDRSSYSRTFSYQGTAGHQYRVTAKVFAKDDNGGDSRITPISPTVTATQ